MFMIQVSRLNGSEYYLNPNLIETMEATPDTILTLVSEKKLIIKESCTEIKKRIIEYNRKIFIEKSEI